MKYTFVILCSFVNANLWNDWYNSEYFNSAFKKIDANGNHRISISEAEDFVNKVGAGMVKNTEIKSLFLKIDKNADGIEKNEIKRYVADHFWDVALLLKKHWNFFNKLPQENTIK